MGRIINLKNNLLATVAILLLITQISHSQVCAIPGKEGNNNSVNSIINTYWTVPIGTYDSTDTSITLQNRRGSAINLTDGDLVLVIQMQCADINFTDSDSYGDGISGDMQFSSLIASGYTDPVGSCLAGQYEYVRAGALSNSTTLDLSDNPLVNTYIQADSTATSTRRTFQIVRVPQYNNATISANVLAPVWNGYSGGIAALDVARTLDFSGNRIVVNGRGFRGGGGQERNANDPNIRYQWNVNDRHATKGEGIAGTPRFVSNKRNLNSATATITDLGATWNGYPSGTSTTGDFSRGAPANAGGGGNFWEAGSDNGGGGGGGNGGAGGRGGAGWHSAGYAGILANYSNFSNKKWGFGGSLFSTASVSRAILGGGGGAGDNNANSTPEESSGAAGGGIVMVRARSIVGTGQIRAIGSRGATNSSNDGSGGGGAGGTVIVVTSDMSTSNLQIIASGGRGADTYLTGPTAHGSGGGGGGGVIIRTGAATTNIIGGVNGITNTGDSPPDGADHGAKSGDNGVDTVITVPTDIPGINTGFRCLDFGDAPNTYGNADHNLGDTPEALFLGVIQADGNPETIPNIPSANADADDLSSNDDEDGTTLPTSSDSDGTYTVSTTVFNNTSSPANLCGWVDFDQDGVFQSDESVCTVVNSMVGSQIINLIFTVAIDDRNNTGVIFARLRLTSDALTTSDPNGSASDGEVEDFMTTVTTLPVTINGFESHELEDGLLVKWNTSSETRNIGFYLWGKNSAKNSKEFIRLSQQFIASKSKGALDPQEYEIILSNKFKHYNNLAISAVDAQGNEELFGMYELGQNYGRKNLPHSIDWQAVNHKIIFSNKKTIQKPFNKASIYSSKAQLKTRSYGIHRVTHRELYNAGFDLSGVNIQTIALSLKDQAVARRIGKISSEVIISDTLKPQKKESFLTKGKFGPGMFIDFWVTAPEFPDAEYINHYTYEISINENLTKTMNLEKLDREATSISTYQHAITVNEDNEYAFTNSLPDPWYAKMLRDYLTEEDKSYTAEFSIGNDLTTNKDGTITIKLAGGSDLPINPDHQVQISINNTALLTFDFDGIKPVTLDIPVASNLLQAGNNTVKVKLTSGTAAQFDLVLIDEIKLSYSRSISLSEGILTIFNQSINNNMSLQKPKNGNLIAYASNDLGNLTLLEYSILADESVLIATIQNHANYWISNVSNLHRITEIKTIETDNLLTKSGDFIVIAHPAFMPSSVEQDHPLNRYIQHRQAQGWQIKMVSIKDIQSQYSSGMPLPNALTKFLKASDQAFEFSHILLVGSDSYDYKDHLGLQSISFIPTKYASTLFIPHTPSDQLLADIDDDNISDKAIGRWPIRSLSDLSSIVEKTILWDESNDLDAIFVTDKEDNNSKIFESQSARLVDLFIDNNWSEDRLIEIYSDQQVPTNVNIATQVRQQLFHSWENKKSLTNFIGHGSPTQWSRQGILNANDIDDLFNMTSPTLIGTLTCYTSYFVSPKTNTLAHRLINGSDNQTNGAVAIHGAASLSAYSSNELFAKEVLKQQLTGKTLGQAINIARQQAYLNGYTDQVINWTLLGDPTILIRPNN